jgi:hypothetical protein
MPFPRSAVGVQADMMSEIFPDRSEWMRALEAARRRAPVQRLGRDRDRLAAGQPSSRGASEPVAEQAPTRSCHRDMFTTVIR